jgi:hypothetical protein
VAQDPKGHRAIRHAGTCSASAYSLREASICEVASVTICDLAFGREKGVCKMNPNPSPKRKERGCENPRNSGG